MDTNIQNKFIMNVLNIDEKDAETIEYVDDTDGNFTVYITLSRNDKDVCPACGKPGKVHGYTKKKKQ